GPGRARERAGRGAGPAAGAHPVRHARRRGMVGSRQHHRRGARGAAQPGGAARAEGAAGRAAAAGADVRDPPRDLLDLPGAARLGYLQKLSAWQEVARRLAHEIKNPLTPIQLAVQELASKYRGDDPQYQRLLGTAQEIMNEEVGVIRRLVDDFSAFAKLPKVEP